MVSAITSATGLATSSSTSNGSGSIASLEKQLTAYKKELAAAEQAGSKSANSTSIQQLQQKISSLETQIESLRQQSTASKTGGATVASAQTQTQKRPASGTLGNNVDVLI